jgi:general stress protein CsbA
MNPVGTTVVAVNAVSVVSFPWMLVNVVSVVARTAWIIVVLRFKAGKVSAVPPN